MGSRQLYDLTLFISNERIMTVHADPSTPEFYVVDQLASIIHGPCPMSSIAFMIRHGHGVDAVMLLTCSQESFAKISGMEVRAL